MRNKIILILGLAVVVLVYSFNKQSTGHIEDYNAAVDHLNKGEYASAVPYLEKARAAKPNEERILRALEEAYRESGQTAKAEEVAKQLVP